MARQLERGLEGAGGLTIGVTISTGTCVAGVGSKSKMTERLGLDKSSGRTVFELSIFVSVWMMK